MSMRLNRPDPGGHASVKLSERESSRERRALAVRRLRRERVLLSRMPLAELVTDLDCGSIWFPVPSQEGMADAS